MLRQLLKQWYEPKGDNSSSPADDYEINAILYAMFNYRSDSLNEIKKKKKNFENLPKEHLKFLKYDCQTRMTKLKAGIKLNTEFLN